jgi:hypothetical protein
MNSKSLLVLRFAIAFTFFYAAISGFINPGNWIGYFPTWFALPGVPMDTLLIAWNIFEILLGGWILFGKKIFIPSIIAALLLLGITVVNFGQIEILFRDIALGLAALSLALANWKR